MFELAQARLTRRNLLISFDFSESSKLKSDLDHFRTQVNTAAQTVQLQGLENWEPAQYWGLIHMLEKHTLHGTGEAMNGHADERDWITGYYVGDPAIDAWIDEYLRKRRYPAVLPEIPESNEQELDQQLAVVREILRMAIDECRLYGVDREGLRMRRHELPPLGRIPSRPLAFTDSDHTLGRLLTSIWRIATQFRETANADGPRAVADELRAYLEDAGIHFEFSQMARDVADLLSLPQWKHRHELYAVWLASKVVQESGPESAEVEVVDNCLPFSFRPSRLALIRSLDPPLDLWLEVQEPTRQTRRQRAPSITYKPDMVIYKGPRTSSEDGPFCVIEAKHYARASGSFGAVLRDYSGAHPHADVALANYGPVGRFETVRSHVRREVVAIGECFPSGAGVQALVRFLKSSLERSYPAWKGGGSRRVKAILWCWHF